MTAAGPQVSWKALERDAKVVSADGAEAGTVLEVTGDPNADIFDGLVVARGSVPRYLAAERVTAIWPRRVEVDLTAAQLEELPPYEEPVVARLEPKDGVLSRLRRLFS